MMQNAQGIKNWSGNFQYGTNNIHHPETVEQVQEVTQRLPRLKVLGTRHCFNKIADSNDNLRCRTLHRWRILRSLARV
jgi:xylitol oxidase